MEHLEAIARDSIGNGGLRERMAKGQHRAFPPQQAAENRIAHRPARDAERPSSTAASNCASKRLPRAAAVSSACRVGSATRPRRAIDMESLVHGLFDGRVQVAGSILPVGSYTVNLPPSNLNPDARMKWLKLDKGSIYFCQ